MTCTSDDRREIAARLRDDDHGYETEYDFLVHVLGMPRENHGQCDWSKVHKRLADLIDPTCHMVDTDHEYEDSIRCDVCQATFNRPWEPFKFCQHCGARVVDEDD